MLRDHVRVDGELRVEAEVARALAVVLQLQGVRHAGRPGGRHEVCGGARRAHLRPRDGYPAAVLLFPANQDAREDPVEDGERPCRPQRQGKAALAPGEPARDRLPANHPPEGVDEACLHYRVDRCIGGTAKRGLGRLANPIALARCLQGGDPDSLGLLEREAAPGNHLAGRVQKHRVDQHRAGWKSLGESERRGPVGRDRHRDGRLAQRGPIETDLPTTAHDGSDARSRGCIGHAEADLARSHLCL